MTGKIGLLYVKNTKTLQPLSQEIKSLIGQKQRVVDAGVDEGKIITGKLRSVAKSIGKDLELVSSLIVITDNVFWDTFWKEPSNKIQNKLEELLGDDEEDEGIDFILVVVCNINHLLLPACFPSFAPKVTERGEKEEYMRHESKVYHMVVSMDNNTPDIIKRLAKDIVDKFNKLICYNTSKDQVDTVTPVQTPIHSIEPKFPKMEIVEDHKQAPCFYLNTTDEDENLTDSGDKINVNATYSGEKHENGNAYPLESPGLCLYIGVFEFESKEAAISLQHRRPSAHELKIVRNCFEELGCFVKKKLNPTAQQTEEFLQEAIKWCGKLNPSYVVLIISTHGQEVSIAIKEDKSESTEQHPSGITGQKINRTERVHQLFFQDGTSLFTRDIVRMFDRRKCPALKGKPCFYFIQSCRSRFDLHEHTNFDPGVMVNVLTEKNDIRAGTENPDSVEASGVTSHQDTTDAKKSTRKQTEEDKEARIKQIQEASIRKLTFLLQWLEKEKLYTKILNYTAFLVKVNPPTLTHEAQKTNDKMATHLSETLLAEGLSTDQVTKIKKECQGYEQEILDFFFPEPIICDPPPCVNDTLVMFASAPGKEAYNRDNQGGWLIKNLETQLKETLETDPEKVDLLAELTKVSWRVAYKYETDTYASESSGHKSVPCLYHRLSKDAVIWPKKIRAVKNTYEKDEKLKDFLKWIDSN
ncbi:uncharacterized protein LOC134283529 [Saccostrea cucullata]|uniref:uncharacterized protein LOC134283529 n=1 Tax=Saccostrea cuccullata TaxID=36930 RepID=UPI002ED68E8E